MIDSNLYFLGEENMLLDVIVPVYNNVLFLEKCIDSILATTSVTLGIILVDDGSFDGSEELCDQFARTNDRIIVIHKSNGGVMSAIDMGIEYAHGDYITIVDSDDWLEEGTYDNLKQYLDRGCDVITFPMLRFFSEKNLYKEKEQFEGEYYRGDIVRYIYPQMIWDFKQNRFGIDPSLCNKVFKRKLLAKYIHKASFLKGNYGQDVAVLYPLMKEAESVIFADNGAYYHRQRTAANVAPYFRADDYSHRLLDLYEYLMDEFDEQEDIKKQIDYFYAYSVNLRLRIYGEEIPRRYYLFPYAKVRPRSRIILYGAGKIGNMYRSQIEKSDMYTLVAWSDKYVEEEFDGVRVVKPQEIPQYDYDNIVIAIEARTVVEAVKTELCSLGIEDEKIVWMIDYIKF